MTASEFELDWLKRWNLYSPNAIAVFDGETGIQRSYKEIFYRACVGAKILSENFNVKHGDRVVLLSTNELECFDLFFSLQRLGATLVPINFRLTEREVSHIVSDCDPKLIITQKTFLPVLENQNAKVILLNEGSDSFASLITKKIEYFESKNLNFEEASFQQFLSEPEDAALLLYTSGTTGAPKGAILSHRMLFWNSVNTTLRLNINQSDSAVIFLPLFHTGGWNVLTTPFLHRGAKVILVKKFEPDLILKLTEQEKCTLLFGVPTTMDMMARSAHFSKADLSSLRYAIVGGEPMPVPLIRTWADKSVPIRQGYGLTEFGPNVFSLNEEDAIRKIGSIGFPNFYIDARVVDDHGQDVGQNEIGELILKGPMMMSGYWKNQKATEETIRNDWLYTGDLVRKDSEGYFYVVGRKKDMFISGGENVYPPEVEQVLRSFPGVLEAAVIGVADEKWGEVGFAFIAAKDTITEESLRNHCLQNLAKFKIPKKFKFLSELPKGDSGKILKRQLIELI